MNNTPNYKVYLEKYKLSSQLWAKELRVLNTFFWFKFKKVLPAINNQINILFNKIFSYLIKKDVKSKFSTITLLNTRYILQILNENNEQHHWHLRTHDLKINIKYPY